MYCILFSGSRSVQQTSLKVEDYRCQGGRECLWSTLCWDEVSWHVGWEEGSRSFWTCFKAIFYELVPHTCTSVSETIRQEKVQWTLQEGQCHTGSPIISLATPPPPPQYNHVDMAIAGPGKQPEVCLEKGHFGSLTPCWAPAGHLAGTELRRPVLSPNVWDSSIWGLPPPPPFRSRHTFQIFENKNKKAKGQFQHDRIYYCLKTVVLVHVYIQNL